MNNLLASSGKVSLSKRTHSRACHLLIDAKHQKILHICECHFSRLLVLYIIAQASMNDVTQIVVLCFPQHVG
jgi:hypothetical protein